jgi:hypothetical protein
MPRPRKNDPSGILNPILSQFAARIALTVERFTIDRVEQAIREQARALKGRGLRGVRPEARCYYPGCTNIAAPRFGMFCAARHKNLPKPEKEKYRALRAAARKRAQARRD